MRIDDKSEELKDYIHEGYGMSFSPELIKSMVSHIEDQHVARCIGELLKTKCAAKAYGEIKQIDREAAEKLLPFIKTITIHCMMLKNDCLFYELNNRFIECVQILRTSTSRKNPGCVFSREEGSLVNLMRIWQENGLPGKWNQIKEFPEMPVAQSSKKHQKRLLEADRLFTELLSQHKDLLMRYEEQTIRQEISKEITARSSGSRDLLEVSREEVTRRNQSSHDAEIQTDPPEESRTQESTGSVASLQQDQQAPAGPDTNKTGPGN